MTVSTMRAQAGRARLPRARAGLVAVSLLAALIAAGCGSTAGPERELALVEPPSWFTEPTDGAEPDADPPRWTRRYDALPKPSSDVEMVYSQALDRAGWRFHAGACAEVGAPRGGKITADCWTKEGLVLGFTATAPAGKEAGPSRLDVVLHQADRSRPSPSRAL